MFNLPRLVAGALLALLALTGTASAIETGSAGWLIKGQALFEGPGNAYKVVGDVGDETAIRVDRCSRAWCLIHVKSVKGWVSKDNISFGQEPRGPFTGPRLNYPQGGPGFVCLYSGNNYSGSEACLRSGSVVHDLLLFENDNNVASVKIEGNVSVTLCRDRDFSSYCKRIIESTPALDRMLNRAVSSYRVW